MSATALFRWDGLDATAVARRFGLPYVALHAEVESTQDVAHALAEQGAPAGALIVADAQRAGRGRLGRAWSSPPGSGVWCTILERPRDLRALDVLSIRVGLHVAEALDAFADETVRVKWPNDLMLGREKLGGVLVEARWSGASVSWVAIGVGVNVVAPRDVGGAAGLRAGAERVDVLAAIVAAVRSAAALRGQLSGEERERFQSRDALAGRHIVSPAVGRVIGVAADGALIVETAAGPEQHRAGTVRLAEDS